MGRSGISVGVRTAAGCRFIALGAHEDGRGLLTVLEDGDGLPFVPRRLFVISAVPTGATRGGHAHESLEELLVCVHGAVTVDLHRGSERASVRLDSPREGLLVPAGVWCAQRDFTPDAVMVVLASLPFDPDDHVPAPLPGQG